MSEDVPSNRLRNLRLAELIREWLGDESGHDEVVGPELDRILRECPIDLGMPVEMDSDSHRN